jgi:undecaprenyl-diphosphatase
MPTFIQESDLVFSNGMRSLQNSTLDFLTHTLTGITYGGALWMIIALVFWKKGYKLLAAQMAIAILIGLAETSILKHIFHRARPIAVELYEFWMPMHKVFADSYSFPSGHTVLSFAAAGVIFNKYRSRYGWLALLLALIVGLCRIYEGMHWPTDVFIGIFVGIAASATAIYICKRRLPDLKDLPKQAGSRPPNSD